MNQNRLYFMDAVRVFAMFLVLAQHSELSLIPINLPIWAIHDIKAAQPFAYTALFAHLTTMPLFFFLSGFFSSYFYQNLGLKGFVQNRLIRIGIPFSIALLGLFLFHSFFAALDITGSIVKASPNNPHVLTLQHIVSSLFSVGIWQKFYNDVSYFWFLYYLLLLDCLAFLTIVIFGKLLKSRRQQLLAVTNYFPLLFSFAAAALFLVFPQIRFVNSWQLDIPTQLVPETGILLYFGIFFLSGWSFNLNRSAISLIAKISVITGLLTFVIFLPLNYLLELYAAKQNHPFYAAIKLLAGFTNPFTSWLILLTVLGLMYRFANRPNKHTRYLADASYWLYITQVPLIAYMQIYLMNMEMPALLKFGVIMGLALSVLLLSYHYWVRYTVIGTILNGVRVRPRNGDGILDKNSQPS